MSGERERLVCTLTAQTLAPNFPFPLRVPVVLAGFAEVGATPRNASIHAADLRLVQRCLSGDGNAYRELVERHQAQVSAMMWRFSRDKEAHEDLVQDVFVEGYANLAKYRAEAPFAHWLAGIATRLGYQYWRRETRERALRSAPIENWENVPDEAADDLDPMEAGQLLHRLLALLPPRDRLVLTLRYVENHSVEKAAELTGWSPVMVKVQALRARKKLKRLFEKATEEANR
ncbi:MAG: RNA polymerase [Armatimonadetes bacterium CG_4_10_14_3_um_filter_66_18]|nr:RNA polymerase sigma factor [Armatimonadota bacterium]PIU90731.1 MAG: RNA polymerase [Armatimonadetes bacterium CG06_land_8_20_14_3_00_66_21]PIX42386.1 MAG: RNA polymerase [Armatimonadetes bacterium CG_4_8_14_3_um_filter_66_20]PIY42321.1 MAG: RNA polymerase [Armatimonadetes bacterium CG_4_10_14_3_um_filter_66_18]PIZ48510.1 MAG: RNA polymerase [Armatimonadetes bacterium CG_4_10_14_0_8_um_filter_66_14]PJB74354.1 MAG: RNA polymerase [Armatimonadetes bacterium CG_4_9_14_3_um_filter_66_14]